MSLRFVLWFFFFNDTATTEIYTRPYTLSLHDALPITRAAQDRRRPRRGGRWFHRLRRDTRGRADAHAGVAGAGRSPAARRRGLRARPGAAGPGAHGAATARGARLARRPGSHRCLRDDHRYRGALGGDQLGVRSRV